MLNPSSDSLFIHKGTIIGSFTEISPEETIINFDSEPQLAPMSVHSSMPCIPDSDSSFSSIFQSIRFPDLNEKDNSALRGLLTSYKDIFHYSTKKREHCFSILKLFWSDTRQSMKRQIATER